MTTAPDSASTGRVYWVVAVTTMVAVLAVTSYSAGWLLNVAAEPADPDLTVGQQTELAMSARLALVNWVIGVGALVVMALIAFLARKWLLVVERQASAAESQLASTREQLELAQRQLDLNRESAAGQALTAEMNLRSDRFSRAILQATGSSAAVRAVGLLALEDLVVEYEEPFAIPIYEFLVALVKEKTTPDPDQQRLHMSAPDSDVGLRPQVRALDSDVETAIAILTRNRAVFDRNATSLSDDTQRNGGTGLHLVDTDWSGVWLPGLNLSGATFTNVRLDNAVLVDADLTKAIFTNCRANAAMFESVDFTRARFNSSTFAESTFADTTFDRATVSAADFGAATITKSSFKRSNATGTSFVGATFTDASFDEALLTGTSFHGALFTDLGSANSTFTKSTLSSVAFNETSFAGTDFAKAAINDTDYRGARLADVGFTDAQLRQTNFNQSTLNTVSFQDAELFDVTFDDATLTNTSISPTNTADTDLSPKVEEQASRG